MAVTVTKKFYVGDVSNLEHLRGLGISNIGDVGFDASDRQRLYMHYDSKAGKMVLNPLTDVYGRANLMGGNYTFDPNADYLNNGFADQTRTNPIVPGSSGLERENLPTTGPGGSRYGPGNLQIGIPRMSHGDSGGLSTNGPSCPVGFYYYNGLCVPGVNLDPTNPNNVLGINTGSGSFQNAKGVILRVITPVSTQKGKLFQIVTNIQNIGHKPGKFFTKVSIPQLGLAEVESNSAFLQGGQQGVLYATLQMPSEIPANTTLITVQSDLYQSNIGNPAVTPQREDTNQAQMPSPGTQYGMPPPKPPIPQFPVSTGNTSSYGYPFNPPTAPPRYPMPPMMPYRGFFGEQMPYYSGPYEPGMMYALDSPYGAATPPAYPIYPNSPASDPYNYYAPPPVRYLGPPIPMPEPQIIEPEIPSGYQLPAIQLPDFSNSADGGSVDLASGIIKGGGSGGGTVNLNTGQITGGGSGGGSFNLGHPIINQNNNIDRKFNGDDDDDGKPSHIRLNKDKLAKKIKKSARHHQLNHHQKGKRHFPHRANLAIVTPFEEAGLHRAGSIVGINLYGFYPGEEVVIQLYSMVTPMGIHRFKQKIGHIITRAGPGGITRITMDLPKTLRGKEAAVVAVGLHSRIKVVEMLRLAY